MANPGLSPPERFDRKLRAMSEAPTAAAGKMPALQPARRSLFIRGHSLVKPDAQTGSHASAIAQAASFSPRSTDGTLALELPFLP